MLPTTGTNEKTTRADAALNLLMAKRLFELKEMIRDAGASYEDCVEKSDLAKRALDTMATKEGPSGTTSPCSANADFWRFCLPTPQAGHVPDTSRATLRDPFSPHGLEALLDIGDRLPRPSEAFRDIFTATVKKPWSEAELRALRPRDLKRILEGQGHGVADCLEKDDFVAKILRLGLGRTQ